MLSLRNVRVGKGVWAPCLQVCAISKKELWPLRSTELLNSGLVPNGGAKKRQRRESPDCHTKMRQPTAPWWPDGSPAVLQRPWWQTGVKVGLGAERGQARQERRAKSPATGRSDVGKATFIRSSGLGGGYRSMFKSSALRTYKSQARGKSLPMRPQQHHQQ